MTLDPADLLTRLISCPSVTPADAGAQAVLAEALEAIGFTVHRLCDGVPPDGPIDNLFAVRGRRAPHLAFAGHSDVVPPGGGWTGDPFTAMQASGTICGRGAVDMKGAIAAFVAAAAQEPDHGGTLSLLITGDEEGPATFGTVSIMQWMAERGIRPDMILVGEPTCETTLGDTIKIGRRGSVNIRIEVPGVQGHVAYPHLSTNPIPPLARIVAALSALSLDEGTAWFQPSNLEVTTFDVGNAARNVVPARAEAWVNVRFNAQHRGDDVIARVRAIAQTECSEAMVSGTVSGEAFLTEPGPLSALVAEAVHEIVGIMPQLSTGGGTSDARFLSRIAPTVEFGLVNATMHKVDEAVPVADLHALTAVYAAVIRRACAAG